MLLALQVGFFVAITVLCMASSLNTYSGKRLF